MYQVFTHLIGRGKAISARHDYVASETFGGGVREPAQNETLPGCDEEVECPSNWLLYAGQGP